MHRIIAVTPAGRRRYLELLAHYVLSDDTIAQWQLWDNCRDPSDRQYLEELAHRHPKIQIVRVPGADGGNLAINRFYKLIQDPDAFYIKMDDDIVFLPRNFGGQLYQRALEEKERYAWWSPVVINNALCSWLLKHHSRLRIEANLSAQAGCVHGWRSPAFARKLHHTFIDAAQGNALDVFQVPHFEVCLARYSINCLGIFGQDVASLGDEFCPVNEDDEEWISAVLPSRLQRPGRIVGNLVVSHFSFFTQEQELLACGMLDEYYRLAGLRPAAYQVTNLPLKTRIKRKLLLRLLGELKNYSIALPA